MVQGVDESRAWIMKTSDLDVNDAYVTASSVTSVKCYSYDEHTGVYTDTTATNLPAGVASISGRFITLPVLTALAEGVFYRIECKYVSSGNTLEKYMWVRGER